MTCAGRTPTSSSRGSLLSAALPLPSSASEPSREAVSSRLGLAGTYFSYFAIVGIVQPFLPAYLKSLSLTNTRVGLLLGLPPMLALFGPMLWGYVADHTGQPGKVLTLLSLGALIAFSPMLVATRFEWLALILTAYAVFSSSMTTLLDSMTLHRVSIVGGNYARVRLFGSIGYMVSSLFFGIATKRIDVTVVAVCVALWVMTFLWSLSLRVRIQTGSRPRPWSGFELLQDRELRLLLIASSLHWIASAAYHGQFGIHAVEIGFKPWVTGAAFAIGVLAEVLVMAAYPLLASRWSPRTLLAVSFLATSLRWFGFAITREPAVIMALSTIHGLTFGVFFSASVTTVAQRVPAGLRASGQALYVSFTFGIGALVGNVLAGWLHDRISGHGMFAAAAALELVPALLVLRLLPRPTVLAAADPR